MRSERAHKILARTPLATKKLVSRIVDAIIFMYKIRKWLKSKRKK